MKNQILFPSASLSLILFFSTLCPAQPKATAAADRSWPAFYASFRTAVLKRDKEFMRKVMLPDQFELESEFGTPEDVFTYLDKSGDGWRLLMRMVKVGKVTGRGRERTIKWRGVNAGLPVGFIFKSNRWHWSAYLARD